jgi:hypothetical protein
MLGSFHGDLNMGRKIPRIISKAGFHNVTWEVQTMDFQLEQKEKEIEQVKSRFDNSLEFYINIFGNEFEAKKFKNDLLRVMTASDSPIFYNKFIVSGVKK